MLRIGRILSSEFQGLGLVGFQAQGLMALQVQGLVGFVGFSNKE